MVERNLVTVVRVVLELPEAELARLAAHLSDTESARMARFRYRADRRRYLVAHGVLREILAECTGVPPAGLRFREGPHGKPFLDAPDVNFNLSHSGELALVAVSANRDVGVDVEKLRSDLDVLAIARRYFAPEEVAELAGLPATERTTAFFTLWTQKEAYGKARGIALAPALRESAGITAEWSVESIDVGESFAGEGYSAAVAYGLAGAPFLRPNSNLRPRIILTMR